MSRSKACPNCARLEAELAKWRQDYKDLALAIAKRDGYTTVTGPTPGGFFSAQAARPVVVPFEENALPPESTSKLPPEIWAAIERTTFAASDERKAAIEAARDLLELGTSPEEVIRQLEAGEDVMI